MQRHLFNSDQTDDDDYDSDDLITFQLESKIVNIYYLNFCKYSKLIRNKYLISDIKNRFSNDIHEFQTQNAIDLDNIFLFFDLLQQNFNTNENFSLTYKQYLDLFKISEFLQVKKLTTKLNKFFQKHQIDSSFIIQIVQYETSRAEIEGDETYEISQQMEELLSQKISECLINKEFENLPISVIYRILSKSEKHQIQSNELLEFIYKSIRKFCVLFAFVDVGQLRDEEFIKLYDKYCQADQIERAYFEYLPCNLEAIKKLKAKNKILQSELDENLLKINEKEEDNKKLCQRNDQLDSENHEKQQKIIQLETENQLLQQKVNELETENQIIQQKLNGIEIENQELKKKSSEFENSNKRLMQQVSEIENDKKRLQEELELKNKCQITGTIEAKVNNGLFFDAEIRLNVDINLLDTKKSKYIISDSNAKSLSPNAYENGECITSVNQKLTNIGCKSGTHYVRAIVFDKNGKMSEIVSNPITTSGSDMKFDYTGHSKEIILAEGKYKLEVWGGQGGSAIQSNKQLGNGGLGGYSTGTLALKKPMKIIVYVGGKGQTAKSPDGSETSGGFPDGGGTKTGYNDRSSKPVPGTGGGSTSLRIATDSLYSRIIVAGGGGGASGTQSEIEHGGWGGGKTGGNSYCNHSLQDQGAGTQTGSSPGPRGTGVAGVAGTFGRGANGLYCSGRDSGGGGGGGWYGGGSGGYGGVNYCASGGGGSGWIFTESSYNTWKAGDQSNAEKFLLDSTYYLINASTLPGTSKFPNPTGNRNEIGHEGHGYAKITPE